MNITKGFVMNLSKITKTVAIFSIVSAFTLSGCSEINISDETKKNGIEIICASSSVLVGQLGVGGAVTRTAAGVIADNAKDKEIVKIAKKVEKGDTDKKLIKKLQNYVKKTCK